MSRWTQACCDDCWEQREGQRIPVRLKGPDWETCCVCGYPTQSGIYIRVDPDTVDYPQHGVDE